MKIYLSGPMSGHDPDWVSDRFRMYAGHVIKSGHHPVSPLDIPPHKHEGECPPGRPGFDMDDHNEACHLREDMKVLLCCDAILLLPGWESSWGARMELQTALGAGLKVILDGTDLSQWT